MTLAILHTIQSLHNNHIQLSTTIMKCPSILLGKTKNIQRGNSCYSPTSAVSQVVMKEGEQSAVLRKMFLIEVKVCSVLLCQHAPGRKGSTTPFILGFTTALGCRGSVPQKQNLDFKSSVFLLPLLK